MPVTTWPCVNELFDLNKLGQGSHRTYFMSTYFEIGFAVSQKIFFFFLDIHVYGKRKSHSRWRLIVFDKITRLEHS